MWEKQNIRFLLFELPNGLHHQEIIVGKLDGISFHITSTTRIFLDNLYSDQEETDSHMFVCAAHISSTRNVNRLIIRSPDTDVAAIACYHSYHSL